MHFSFVSVDNNTTKPTKNQERGIYMEKAQEKPKRKVTNDPLVVSMSNHKTEKNDPNGSYTGVPVDINEVPVQDADDL